MSMSYILDALNKSEQQKERQQPPRLTSIHHKPGPTGSSPWKWISVLVILGLLNGFFFWYWTRHPEPGQATQPEAVTPESVIRAPERQVTEQPEPDATPDYEGELITPDTINQAPARRTGKTVDPVSIAELPADVQRRLPDLSFSSHIYSEDPSLRVVNINGRNVREGEIFANDLELVEITEEGVVLRYLHYTFEMSVIRDWSFD
ncbi:MAG: general secretion pathway protein GspB [Pseudomonadales bacterium]|nr:general secretion pathway protein GspB [Pseudomonadales bacterium]